MFLKKWEKKEIKTTTEVKEKTAKKSPALISWEE